MQMQINFSCAFELCQYFVFPEYRSNYIMHATCNKLDRYKLIETDKQHPDKNSLDTN